MSAARVVSAPGLVAVGLLAAVQRPDEQADDRHQHRHADHHDEAERHRRVSRMTGHRDDRDDGPGAAGGDVDGVADVADVGGADADDLAGGQPLGQGGAEVAGVPHGQLDGAVGGGEPVGDRDSGGAGCRPPPAATPRPNSTAAQPASAEVSRATMPASMARPIAAGISAWLTIQTMPVRDAEAHGASLQPHEPPEIAGGGTVIGRPGVGDR